MQTDTPALQCVDLRCRLTRLGFGLLRIGTRLSYRNMMRIGRFIGRRLLKLDAERSRIAAINLDLTFPLLGPQQQRELMQQHFESVGMGIVERALSWWGGDDVFKPLIRIKGLEHLHNAQAAGKGVILLSGHFTSPDVMLRALKPLIPVTALYRPDSNAEIDHIVRGNRSQLTHQCLDHENLQLILQALKSKQAVLVMPDGNPGHRQALFADFFGVAAETNTAVSRFARMSHARVVPTLLLRREDCKGYDLIFESALPDFPGDDLQQDTQRINNIIERWAQTEPAQYAWSYPRFRERPNNEPAIY
ncbi:MAG: lysophospholipid acyltransferase family protein [Chromatiales bacterium]